MNLRNLHSIYFLGIGGIGMSALARYFNAQGITVAGYDKTPTPLTQQLIEEGIQIHYEDEPNLIPSNIELVIYTPAIPKDSKELNFLRNNNFTLKKRSEVLGMLTQDHFTIAVAGTHGKTSITSIVAHILKSAGCDVTAFVGGICKNYNSNLILSPQSKIMVVEADEFDRSFLTLHPDVAVISSVDADHLDIYNTKEKFEESFFEFAGQVKSNGKIVVNANVTLPVKFYSKKTDYSIKTVAGFYGNNIRVENGRNIFDLHLNGESVKDIPFGIPGNHNIENAVAAAGATYLAGIQIQKIADALTSYQGVQRRFDYRINTPQIVFIDDYAHHPTELKSAIGSVKALYPNKKITGIFQPHLFSRTRDFLDDFATSLALLDSLILLDIYPARELPIAGITSAVLLEKVKLDDKKLCFKEELISEIESRNPEVLLTLGAGDIDQLVEPIEKSLNHKYAIANA